MAVPQPQSLLMFIAPVTTKSSEVRAANCWLHPSLAVELRKIVLTPHQLQICANEQALSLAREYIVELSLLSGGVGELTLKT